MIVIIVSALLLWAVHCWLQHLEDSWKTPPESAAQTDSSVPQTTYLDCFLNYICWKAQPDNSVPVSTSAAGHCPPFQACLSRPASAPDCNGLSQWVSVLQGNPAKLSADLLDKLKQCNPQINIRFDSADSKKNLIQIAIPSALQQQLVNASIKSENKRHAVIEKLISAAEKEKPGDTMTRKFHKVVIAAISLLLLTILVAAIWHLFALFLKKDSWQSPTLLEDKEKEGGDKKSGISANLAAFIPLFFVAGGTSLVGYQSLVADAMAMPATSMLQTLGSADSLNGASQLAAMANSLNNTTHIENKTVAADSGELAAAINALVEQGKNNVNTLSKLIENDHKLIKESIATLNTTTSSLADLRGIGIEIGKLSSSVTTVNGKIDEVKKAVEKATEEINKFPRGVTQTNTDGLLTSMVIANSFEIDRLKQGTVKTNEYAEYKNSLLGITMPPCKWEKDAADKWTIKCESKNFEFKAVK